MLVSSRDLKDGERIEADICVIGAGAAGITLGLELAESRLRVIVLEAGGEAFDPDVQDSYRGSQSGLPYHDLDVARLRYLGGSTNHWGGYCIPWLPVDFEERPGIPLSGWPIGAGDVFPHYPRAQEIVGLGGQDFGTGFWLRPDEDIFDGAVRPVTCLRTNQRFLAEIYGPALRATGNVTVLLGAEVMELVATERADHVDRVEARGPSGAGFSVAARTVVLATGGIENARLLLLSDRVQRDGLGNTHGWVGRCFMDHVSLEAGRFMPSKPLPSGVGGPDRVGPDGADLRPLLAVSEQRRREEGLARCLVAFRPLDNAAKASRGVKALKHLASRAAQGEVADNFMHHLGLVLRDLDQVAELVGERYLGVAGPARAASLVEAASIELFLELTPNPASRVTLGEERDRLGRRRTHLDWRIGEADRHTVDRTLAVLATEMGRLGLGRVAEAQLEEGWQRDVTGSFHHMGTTRMAGDPRWGVVDRDCRVHGIDNLYVAGSSVFATGGSGTPTLFLTALAVRLAAHLRSLPA